jgi:large subunit ribosomal protein L29
MKSREIRALDDEKLIDALEDYKEALFNLRFQKAFGQLEDQTAIRKTRRIIARIKTEMTARAARAAAQENE